MDLFVILVVEDQAIILVVINADCVRGSESLQVFSTSIDGVSDSDCRNYFAAVRADLVLFIFLAKSEPDLVYYWVFNFCGCTGNVSKKRLVKIGFPVDANRYTN